MYSINSLASGRISTLFFLFFCCFVNAQTPVVNITGNNCPGSLLTVSSSIQPGRITWSLNGQPLRTDNGTWKPNAVTVAGGNGWGSNANQFHSPDYFYVDGAGNIYVSDFDNYRVQKWVPGATTGITVAGGNGQGSAANQLGEASGVCVDAAGNVYVADYQNYRVQKWAPGATTGITVAGGNGNGSAPNQLSVIFDIAIDASGNLYVNDDGNARIQVWRPGATSGIVVAGGNGVGNAANQLYGNEAMYVDPAGNIYVLDWGNDRIQEWAAGATSGITLPITYSKTDNPMGIFVDGIGNVYLPIQANGTIVEWMPGATSGITIAGDPTIPAQSGPGDLFDPWSVYVDNSGNMFIADAGNQRIQKFLPQIPDTLTALLPGTYTATITTFSGQIATASFTIDPSSIVTITANPGNAICAGQQATFTATIVNGGTVPSYQWSVNGINTGTNNSVYSSTSLAVNDVVSCTLTANTGCTRPAASNAISMTVNPNMTPGVTIDASSVSICKNASVTFTASPGNGGAAPTYQWQLNGLNTGSNSPTYQSSVLNNGDAVSCIMTSNATCLTSAVASSNTIDMTVSASLSPSIMISSPLNTICKGSNVQFTAIPSNGGAAPSYQWQVNGINTGENTPSYQSSSLNNGDIIDCIMTASLSCASNAGVTSNAIAMTVNPILESSVNITASSGAICEGETVSFIAAPVNDGSLPSYQWQLNGLNVGMDADTYTNSNLANGDQVKCIMTSNEACISNVNSYSNNLTISVSPKVATSVSIASSSTNLCSGSAVTFAATPVNGGSSPYYQWRLNGVDIGVNNPVYSTNLLSEGDIVNCLMTSNAGCVLNVTSVSNNLSPTVKQPVNSSVGIVVSANDICFGDPVSFTATPTYSGDAPVYQWQLNGGFTGSNSPSYTSYNLNNGDVVNCIMTSSLECTTAVVSGDIIMAVRPLPSITLSASDTVLLYGQEARLLVTANTDILNYLWAPAGSLNNPSIQDPVATPSSNTTYEVTVRSTDGCQTTAGINIKVYRTIKIPNAFTPNGDGKNDIFRIPSGVSIALTGFSVFDRWGNMIFTTNDSSKGWDGTYKGHPCEPDTYVYMIAGSDNNGKILLKGTVMLIR